MPPAKEIVRVPVPGSKTEISRIGPNIFNQDYLKLRIGNGPENLHVL